MTEPEALVHEIISNQIELLEMQAVKLDEAAAEIRGYTATLRDMAARIAYDLEVPSTETPGPHVH